MIWRAGLNALGSDALTGDRQRATDQGKLIAEIFRLRKFESLSDALLDCMAQIEAFDPGGCHAGAPHDRLAKPRAAIALIK